MLRRILLVDSNYEFPNEIELLELNRRKDMKIMGWKPPQRPAWVKEIKRTPGHTTVQLLLLLILATSSVTSTASLISRRGNSTLVGNTSIRNVSLEVAREGLRLRVTGKNTMEALKNLKQIDEYLETRSSNAKSSPSTKQKAK